MNTGSEASEQIIQVMLQGTEIALRLTGSATKNMAAMLYAYQNIKAKLHLENVEGRQGATNIQYF